MTEKKHERLAYRLSGIIALIGPNGAGKSRWIPSTSPPATATISRANWQYCNNKPAS